MSERLALMAKCDMSLRHIIYQHSCVLIDDRQATNLDAGMERTGCPRTLFQSLPAVVNLVAGRVGLDTNEGFVSTSPTCQAYLE
jgi:hypothetical protein